MCIEQNHCHISFLKGSVADPFYFHMDPDPTENTNFLETFFSIKDIFLQKMICFVIYGVNIYVR